MTDVIDGEAVTVDTTKTAPEAVVSSPGNATERNYEAEAAEMGWRPKEEWTGKPENWKSAKTYVEHGDTDKRVAKIEKDYADRFAKLEKVTAKTIAAVEKDAADKIAQLTADRLVAIKAGDVDKVEAIEGKIADLRDDAAVPEKKLTGAALEKHNIKVQADWTAKQDWWDVDEDMTAWAIGKSQNITAKNPTITMEDNLAQVEAALAKKYPDKFGKTDAHAHAPVDSGGDFPGGGKTDPLSKLPAEAKAQVKSDMAKFPKVYPTADAWLKAYNS